MISIPIGRHALISSIFALCLTMPSPSAAQVTQIDSLALVALYDSTGGIDWDTTWDLNTPVSTWWGVGVTGGRVTDLNLHQNNLTGSIPAAFGGLTAMQHLRLYSDNSAQTSTSNKLTGSIPAELANMTGLVTLDIHRNLLTGAIPSEIGSLVGLNLLSLYQNQLSGSIPPELGNLIWLNTLSLSSNNLTGSIPLELWEMQALVILELANNQLTGYIPPQLGQLTNLVNLYLHGNQLTESIPGDLGFLSNLQNLRLDDNLLWGTLSDSLGRLTNLTTFDVSNNQLTGAVTDSVINLSKLVTLDLQDNQFTWLPNLHSITTLTNLYTQNNMFNFASLVPNIGAASTKFEYSPQGAITTDTTITWGDGGNLVLPAPRYDGLATSYTWYKDGISQLDAWQDPITELWVGRGSSDTLRISDYTISDVGTYYVTAQNSDLGPLHIPSGNTMLFWTDNEHPSLVYNYDAIVHETDTSWIVIHATDAYADSLTFTGSSDTTAVEVTFIDSLLVIVPTPSYRGTASIVFTVTDGRLADTDSISLIFNSPPVLVPQPDVTIEEDGSYQLIIDATDSDLFSTGASIVCPCNVDFGFGDTPGNYLIPKPNWHGSQMVIIHANDAVSTVTDTFMITVTPVYDALEDYNLLTPAPDSVLIVTPEMFGDTVHFAWETAYTPDDVTVLYNLVLEMPDNNWQHTVARTFTDTTGFIVIDSNWVYRAIADSLEEIVGTWYVSAIHSPWSLEALGSHRSFTLKLARKLLAIDDRPLVPTSFALHPNYPNPFNPTTTLRFDLPEATDVSLIVYDLRGREITTLISGGMAGGYHTTVWDGRDGRGRSVPTGIYVAQLVTTGYAKSMKMVLLK